MSSDHQYNVLVSFMNANIILDHKIKTQNGWVAGNDFLWESKHEEAQSPAAPCKKNNKDLHFELWHPSESIIHASAKALGFQVTATFKPCENFALGEDKPTNQP